MNENHTAIEAKRIQKILNQFLHDVRQYEKDNVEFKEYCEGIIMSAYCALGLITGQYK